MRSWFERLAMSYCIMSDCWKRSSGGPRPCCLPRSSKVAETEAMLVWARLASGEITMLKVDARQGLAATSSDQIVDLAT